MVQVIEENPRRSFGRQFLDNEEKLGSAIDRLVLQKKEKQGEQQVQAEDSALKKYGIDTEGVRNPKLRESLLQQHFKTQQEAREKVDVEKNYPIVEEMFGPKIAALWKASPTGGQTEILKQAFDLKKRQMGFDQYFPEGDQQEGESDYPEQPPQTSENGIQSGEVQEWPKFGPPKGMTPKEKVEYSNSLRKENTEKFDVAKKRVDATRKNNNRINVLRKYDSTGKVGSVFVNPKTGDLLAPALANKETQAFYKTLKEWANNAKDSYGSRVTNFDLETYMAQNPSLANTKEGRDLIYNQMSVVNQLDSLYEDELVKVYRKYGLGNIAPEQADELVEKRIADKRKSLEEKYYNVVMEANDKSSKSETENLPEGEVLMRDKKGRPLHVPKDQVEFYKSKGAELA